MMGQYTILNDNDQKEMHSSLLLLMVAHVEKPKKFKHTSLRSLHFDACEAGHLKESH
jgi:hypothetical protein